MKVWLYILVLVAAFFILSINDSHADKIQISPWIKNNAKWWSQGQISDNDFVKGIQYLIEQKIIQIPQTSVLSDTHTTIPMWIRNNAGWWANGTIGDEDFVKGIQYLIQINVINVNYLKTFLITSSAFENNGTIPVQYTCDGKNISPPLAIAGIPENTKSLALIVDDIDAPRGIFTHWTVWNIPANKIQFSEGEHVDFPQGITSMNKSGYGGPCPPPGHIHRYLFKLYALNSTLNLDENATKNVLEQSMNDSIISQTVLVGTYSR